MTTKKHVNWCFTGGRARARRSGTIIHCVGEIKEQEPQRATLQIVLQTLWKLKGRDRWLLLEYFPWCAAFEQDLGQPPHLSHSYSLTKF
jgi:hypothetical protein